jgi:16S rRNA (guanine966-N2)-methyltransferase
MGDIRLIGGIWKRTKLRVTDKPGLRPSPERVRETLFNWLGQQLEGWLVIDAFAGTGALGLEAASRGAKQVFLIETDPHLHQLHQQHITRLKASQVQAIKADALNWLKKHPAQAQLVLLDPPFQSDAFAAALQAGAQAAVPGGWVYLESPYAWPAQEGLRYDLNLYRHIKAGAVHAHLWQKTVSPDHSPSSSHEI